MGEGTVAAAGEAQGWLSKRQGKTAVEFVAGGHWLISQCANLDMELKGFEETDEDRIVVDLAALEKLDTAGAWLLSRTIGNFRAAGADVTITGAKPGHASLIDEVTRAYRPCPTTPEHQNAVARVIEHLGESTLSLLLTASAFVEFFGKGIFVSFRTLFHPKRFRLTSTVHHMEMTGLNAIPIAAMMAFLIGIVLVYQGALQLEQFGAQIFVIDLLALSVLRELGVLITAVLVAGRSGSAFAAEIGSMNVHEEIDAMRVLGIDPIETLVIPRVVALVVTLPILTFLADIMGLFGGALMSWLTLDIGPAVFLERLQSVVEIDTFMVGMIKAPFFAVLIGLIGCYEGMQVEGSAESVGHHTTRAVVEAIFLVIISDALFSVFFGILGI
jgi:phospholipid/cholesterol/gamma-HCH transport system permease protein